METVDFDKLFTYYEGGSNFTKTILGNIARQHDVNLTKINSYEFQVEDRLGNSRTIVFDRNLYNDGNYLPKKLVDEIHLLTGNKNTIYFNVAFLTPKHAEPWKMINDAVGIAMYSSSLHRGAYLYNPVLYPQDPNNNYFGIYSSCIHAQQRQYTDEELKQSAPRYILANSKFVALESLILFMKNDIGGTESVHTMILDYITKLEANYPFNSIITDSELVEKVIPVHGQQYQVVHKIADNKYIIYSAIVDKIKSLLK